jgi:hypothetical protein
VAVKKRGIFLTGKAEDIFRRKNDFDEKHKISSHYYCMGNKGVV